MGRSGEAVVLQRSKEVPMKTARWTLGLTGVVLMSLTLACEQAHSPTAPGLSNPAVTADPLASAVRDLAGGQPGTPLPIAGTFTLTFEPVGVRQADGNTFIDFTFHEKLSGSVSGTRVGTGTLVIHPDGSLNVKDAGFLTGTMAGISGSVNAEVWAEGTLASLRGNVTIYPQTGNGGFVGLQGVVKVTGAATGPATLAGSYEGQVHF
jgi:hypothetical protein